MAMRKHLLQYLQYVQNTGGNATVVGFDDDWAPIGQLVREELTPTYIFEKLNGKLALTEAGKAELLSQ